MAEDLTRKRLGRGLAALIGDVGAEAAVERPRSPQRRLPVAFLRANPRNPRKTFDSADLDDLASFDPREGRRPADPGPAGRRAPATPTRSSPASGAGGPRRRPGCTTCRSSSTTSPTRRRSSSPSSRTSSAPTSTRSRRRSATSSSSTSTATRQAELADVIGKSRPHIANTLRLLKLPESVQDYLRERPADGRPCPGAGDARRSGGGGTADRRGRA